MDKGPNNNSSDPSQWTIDKQMTLFGRTPPASAPLPPGYERHPFWAGVGNPWVLGVVGFIFGMLFGQGNWLAGLAGAVIVGGLAFIVRIAFGSSAGSRNYAGKYAAIGFVAGFAVTFLIGALNIYKESLFAGALLGAALGGIIGFIRKR